VVIAPEVFDLDESTSTAVVLQASLTPGKADDVLEAAAQCPVEAIHVSES
jgi:ferredoxin